MQELDERELWNSRHLQPGPNDPFVLIDGQYIQAGSGYSPPAVAEGIDHAKVKAELVILLHR